MSNNPVMLGELSLRCDRSHDHQHLVEGRASAAENYPLDLVMAIVRGMAKTTQALQRMREMQTEQWDMSMNMTVCNSPTTTVPQDEQSIPASSLPNTNGPDIDIDIDRSNVRAVYRDKYTGEELPHHLVRAAMAE